MAQPLPEPWVLCGMSQCNAGPFRLGAHLVDQTPESAPTVFAGTEQTPEYAWFDAEGKRCELGEE